MRYSRWWLQLTAAALAVALIASALAQTMVKVPPATDRFQRTWARTDKPVADGAVSRTWMWGPEANTGAIPEPYAEAPGSSRTVQYFDKSRMEDNSYRATEAPWDVTNGLLVVEMVEGHYQIGDAQFDELPAPADINIAGDPGERPTYADINRLALRTLPATPVGTFITATYRDDNTIGDDPTYISADVTAAQFVPETSHTVASPFWTFMTSSGTVWESDAYVVGPLFLNPFYATGFPITEAYWSSIAVGGTARDVLWQCFERRCLTYTPTNEPAWQVEAGNVGQHYYRWRYEFAASDADGNGDRAKRNRDARDDDSNGHRIIECDRDDDFDCHPHANGDGHRDLDGDTHRDGHAGRDSNTDTDRDPNTHPNPHADTDPDLSSELPGFLHPATT